MYQNVHGGDIYGREIRLDFSVNTNPFGIPESVIRAAKDSIEACEAYPDTQCRELTEKLSMMHRVSKEHIICTNGAAELIFALCFAAQPKKALLIAPGFSEYEQALRLCGCEICYYECSREKGFVIGEDYPDHLREDLDILFLCTPNNPTGIALDRDFLLKALSVCREKKIRMVLDECFAPFLGAYEKLTMQDMVEKCPELFLLRAFTKIYAMPGLRLGYGLCSDQSFMESIRRFLQPWNVSIPAQKAGAAALEETEYVKESRSFVTQEREFLLREMRDRGLYCTDSAANFVFFEGPAGLAAQLAECGILIRDCSNYRGLRNGYYRIAVRRHEENLILLEELDRILSAWICSR